MRVSSLPDRMVIPPDSVTRLTVRGDTLCEFMRGDRKDRSV